LAATTATVNTAASLAPARTSSRCPSVAIVFVKQHKGRYDEVVFQVPLPPRTRCPNNTILGGSHMGGN